MDILVSFKRSPRLKKAGKIIARCSCLGLNEHVRFARRHIQVKFSRSTYFYAAVIIKTADCVAQNRLCSLKYKLKGK